MPEKTTLSVGVKAIRNTAHNFARLVISRDIDLADGVRETWTMLQDSFALIEDQEVIHNNIMWEFASLGLLGPAPAVERGDVPYEAFSDKKAVGISPGVLKVLLTCTTLYSAAIRENNWSMLQGLEQEHRADIDAIVSRSSPALICATLARIWERFEGVPDELYLAVPQVFHFPHVSFFGPPGVHGSGYYDGPTKWTAGLHIGFTYARVWEAAFRGIERKARASLFNEGSCRFP